MHSHKSGVWQREEGQVNHHACSHRGGEKEGEEGEEGKADRNLGIEERRGEKEVL